MKKTKDIQLNHLRKKQPLKPIKRLSLAIAALSLAACSQKQEDVVFVNSPEQCASDTNLSLEDCTIAYKKALEEAEKTAPKYRSRGECEIDFGDERCQRTSSGSFMPFMAGFMVSQLMSSAMQSGRYHGSYSPGFHYRNYYSSDRNKIMTSNGHVIGKPGQKNYRVSKAALKPKPKTLTTVKRGGFGSTAAAKSNWGGGRSSGGWGG